METLLEHIKTADPVAGHIALWREVIDAIRPSSPRAGTDEAAVMLDTLTQQLARNPEVRQVLSTAFTRLFTNHKQVSLYVSSGLLPSTGFFTEAAHRISSSLLPQIVDTNYLKDLLTEIFHVKDDEIWVENVPDEIWSAFFKVLLTGCSPSVDATHSGLLPTALTEILEALRMLSYHISAIGLDPEIVRVEPEFEERESPFLAQNAEVVAYLQHYRHWWNHPEVEIESEAHLGVMLDQCKEVLQRVRRRATRESGASLTLTFTLERLRQHLIRIDVILSLLRELHATRALLPLLPHAVALFKETLRAECRKNRLSDFWSTAVSILLTRMTESASKTGEHYITTTRREYFGMLGSAAIGGVVIALMAACKLFIHSEQLPPLTEAILFCLNYGLGFAFIHVIGGTVATKQPDMTANAIAASIEETQQGKTRSLDKLADTVIRTMRSQFAAIVGNLSLSIPVAILLSFIWFYFFGTHYVSPQRAGELIADVSPFGGALFFAGIAGICLFLSGLVAAYYDNLSAYNRIPERLYQLKWAQRWLGLMRLKRIAVYIENNLGALTGNFFFGFMLGGVTALGSLSGLPLDIRHIAFSAAYTGYATASLDFALPLAGILLPTICGVLLIGAVNLLVSFTLTLYVAMRARSITFAQGRNFAFLVLHRFIKQPLAFFFPPRAENTKTDTAADTNSRAT